MNRSVITQKSPDDLLNLFLQCYLLCLPALSKGFSTEMDEENFSIAIGAGKTMKYIGKDPVIFRMVCELEEGFENAMNPGRTDTIN